jgi:uncharacterized membrane protein
MVSLALATGFFIGIHVLISGTRVRDAIVAGIGERAFLGVFSLASLGGLVWMRYAYGSAPDVHLWGPLLWFRPIALLLMLPAFLLVGVGLTTLSPTVTGGEKRLEGGDAASGILRITRHPFLWGVALWALVHVVANGDGASLIFFSGFLVVALIGPSHLDAKRARRFGERWQAFAAVTSSVPFAAIAEGRNRLVLGELGAGRVALALGAYVLFLFLHAPLFGASPLAF